MLLAIFFIVAAIGFACGAAWGAASYQQQRDRS